MLLQSEEAFILTVACSFIMEILKKKRYVSRRLTVRVPS